jgi:hypothetical protein
MLILQRSTGLDVRNMWQRLCIILSSSFEAFIQRCDMRQRRIGYYETTSSTGPESTIFSRYFNWLSSKSAWLTHIRLLRHHVLLFLFLSTQFRMATQPFHHLSLYTIASDLDSYCNSHSRQVRVVSYNGCNDMRIVRYSPIQKQKNWRGRYAVTGLLASMHCQYCSQISPVGYHRASKRFENSFLVILTTNVLPSMTMTKSYYRRTKIKWLYFPLPNWISTIISARISKKNLLFGGDAHV